MVPAKNLTGFSLEVLLKLSFQCHFYILIKHFLLLFFFLFSTYYIFFSSNLQLPTFSFQLPHIFYPILPYTPTAYVKIKSSEPSTELVESLSLSLSHSPSLTQAPTINAASACPAAAVEEEAEAAEVVVAVLNLGRQVFPASTTRRTCS